MSEYEQVVDGQWFHVRRNNFSHMCCDCHLVHTVNSKIVNGKIYQQWIRHGQATGGARSKFESMEDDDD